MRRTVGRILRSFAKSFSSANLAFWPLLALLLTACSSGRILSEPERLKHGLTGVIYDARLCPTERDARTGLLRESGGCELVTCEPEKGKVVCRARPEPQKTKRR